MHLGGVRFGVTGPLRYTLTAREAIELCRLMRPRTVIPIHYEGWSHFREGREAIERELAAAPEVSGAASAGCRSASRSSSVPADPRLPGGRVRGSDDGGG